jgi:hypothetical protein
MITHTISTSILLESLLQTERSNETFSVWSKDSRRIEVEIVWVIMFEISFYELVYAQCEI